MSDLDFFATGRRVKETPSKIVPGNLEPTETTVIKKDFSESEKLSELKEKLEAEIVLEKQIKETEQAKKRYRAEEKPVRQRVFDKYVQKKTQINEDDYLFLTSMEKSISFARKKLDIDSVSTRMTANTLIRLVVEDFVEKTKVKIEKDPSIYKKLQSEDTIRAFIKDLN